MTKVVSCTKQHFCSRELGVLDERERIMSEISKIQDLFANQNSSPQMEMLHNSMNYVLIYVQNVINNTTDNYLTDVMTFAKSQPK
jgi:hypothetical protein